MPVAKQTRGKKSAKQKIPLPVNKNEPAGRRNGLSKHEGDSDRSESEDDVKFNTSTTIRAKNRIDTRKAFSTTQMKHETTDGPPVNYQQKNNDRSDNCKEDMNESTGSEAENSLAFDKSNTDENEKSTISIQNDSSSVIEAPADIPSFKSTVSRCISCLSFLIFLTAVFIPFIIDVLRLKSPSSGQIARIEQFTYDFNQIKTAFPGQDRRLWTVSQIALESNLKTEDNKEPAILMLASNRGAYLTAQCIAKKLARAFSARCNNTDTIKVDCVKLKGRDGSSAKLDVDGILEKGFRSGACSALISKIENMPAFATTTFYQYCENDNAPFKNVAIIFTVQVHDGKWNGDSFDLNSLPRNKWDMVVGDFLTHTLKTGDPNRMTDEMVSALLSRITPSVVWVKKEDILDHCS